MMRQQHQDHVVVPATPTAGLVVIQSDLALAFFKGHLYRPPHATEPEQFPDAEIGGGIAQIVFDFGGIVRVPAQDHPSRKAGLSPCHR